ncbi:MAG TPA: sugar phosphate isomerase/epimerase family protein [Gemmataceae bacterium]|jgi:L-ribulose-5-phosphate 3-epimerase|nr:sugar phosphate isomerase/epimerase family protein [Gemmataceae bacterium]
MLFGYNTNGFAHHDFREALCIIQALGYQSVALTLDYHALNPFDSNLAQELPAVRHLLKSLKLRCVIETGARFLLDPRHKHQPTLLSPQPAERGKRLDFLKMAVNIGHALEADAVSFWSGTPVDGASDDVLMERLVEGCRELCDHGMAKHVRLAFEPEPGMFIDNMVRFAELRARVNRPNFGLTMDIGHLHCQGETPIADYLRQWRELIWNIHIEDMRKGVHEHLMFGEGEIDFAPVLQTLQEIGYTGGVHVELSRHSHDAVNTARRALAFLRSLAATR